MARARLGACARASRFSQAIHDQVQGHPSTELRGSACAAVRPPPRLVVRCHVDVYASTQVIRDSLAHRRIVVDAVTGGISGVPAPGQPPGTILTAGDEAAICQVAAGAPEAALARALPAPGRPGGIGS